MTEHRAERGGRARARSTDSAVAILAALALLPGAAAQGASGGGGISPGLPPQHSAATRHHHAKAKNKTSAVKKKTTVTRTQAAGGGSSSPFARRGMWIWYVSHTDGGDLASIIADARRYRVGTLMIKSGDGSGSWSQFTPALLRTLHAAGLKVCGWQYVYGNHPEAEAQVGAATVRAGADCLMIDAEGEYEGKYAQAQSYMTTLRSLIGRHFPVGLAGLPYVDYHPGYPYSVFLGPGGGQYNAPQMYWADIGTSVDAVYAHTYSFNALYGRTIAPLGQVSSSPSASDIGRFRQLARAYHAPNVSWWDWQEASSGSWRALSQPVASLAGYEATTSYASLGRGAQGDVVVWAQEHLYAAGYPLALDGDYGRGTAAAVSSFQRAHSIPVTGAIGNLTWHALLRISPIAVRWSANGARAASAGAIGPDGARGVRKPLPRSARLPARGWEISRSHGRG